MVDENTKLHTNLTTIIVLLLKENRLERNIQQAHLAERLNKAPSGLNKIESGKTPLSMDVFLAICNNLNISPSFILSIAEAYAKLLSENGWVITHSSLPESDDALIQEANEYYSSVVFKNRGFSAISLNNPYVDIYRNYHGVEVIGYATFPAFKSHLINNRENPFNNQLVNFNS